MAIFDVAQITEQGVAFVLVPLHANFESKSEQEKIATVSRLRSAASRSGLSGVVVPVWASHSGRLGCYTAERYRAILRGLDLDIVAANINGEIDVKDRNWAPLEA
jgi:hypothetical protein